jgi:hypothetical protein
MRPLIGEIKGRSDSLARRNLQKKNKAFLTPVGTIPAALALSWPAQPLEISFMIGGAAARFA